MSVQPVKRSNDVLRLTHRFASTNERISLSFCRSDQRSRQILQASFVHIIKTETTRSHCLYGTEKDEYEIQSGCAIVLLVGCSQSASHSCLYDHDQPPTTFVVSSQTWRISLSSNFDVYFTKLCQTETHSILPGQIHSGSYDTHRPEPCRLLVVDRTLGLVSVVFDSGRQCERRSKSQYQYCPQICDCGRNQNRGCTCGNLS